MVSYLDWSIFGQRPSQNYNFNVIPGDANIPSSPYFAAGQYYQYYCILSDTSIYRKGAELDN